MFFTKKWTLIERYITLNLYSFKNTFSNPPGLHDITIPLFYFMVFLELNILCYRKTLLRELLCEPLGVNNH
ncbi:hypothetical protein V1477_007098 [Vespula maculifrons]|uniref:Uncharacterized protein n=1 Tax=Vespula maculifrons TaxID=7453 RepID=A0ABD2CHT0_VESMC